MKVRFPSGFAFVTSVAVGMLPATAATGLRSVESNEPPDIAFPVAGSQVVFTDSWNAPRPGGRLHEGTDLFAPKGTDVVAGADGRVAWKHNGRHGRCCAVGLVHAGGWVTHYLHLDNDTPGSDDGRRVGIASDLDVGDHVKRGQLLGWTGDSGNAENTPAHLHFELRDPTGIPVNPYPLLQDAATREAESRPPAGRTRADEGRLPLRGSVLIGLVGMALIGLFGMTTMGLAWHRVMQGSAGPAEAGHRQPDSPPLDGGQRSTNTRLGYDSREWNDRAKPARRSSPSHEDHTFHRRAPRPGPFGLHDFGSSSQGGRIL